jgi:hypothetical protein
MEMEEVHVDRVAEQRIASILVFISDSRVMYSGQ